MTIDANTCFVCAGPRPEAHFEDRDGFRLLAHETCGANYVRLRGIAEWRRQTTKRVRR